MASAASISSAWGTAVPTTQTSSKEGRLNKREGRFVVIDARESMCAVDGSGNHYLRTALRVASGLLRDSCIASTGALFGVMLIGTKKMAKTNAYESIYTLHELAHADATRIAELEHIVLPNETAEGAAAGGGGGVKSEVPAAGGGGLDFAAEVGALPASSPLAIDNAIHECQTAFLQAKLRPEDDRVIMIITNCDEPCRSASGDSAMLDRCVEKARDAASSNIELHILSMDPPPPARPFDIERSFARMLPQDFSAGAAARHKAAVDGTFEAILERARRKVHRKRRLCRVGMRIGPRAAPGQPPQSLELGVQIFASTMISRKPGAVQFANPSSASGGVVETVQLQVVTKWLCQDTGSVLDEADIARYVMYGGRRVVMSKGDVADAKRLVSQPECVVLGFKPLGALREDHAIREPYFIYPDEHTVAGSTRAFAALHAKMLALDQFAVARLQTTSASQMRFVALVAQREEFDEDGVQLTPPGLVAIHLPWADDIRAVPAASDLRVAPSAEQIDAAVAVVDALALDGFDSTAHANPMLQKFYAHLTANAFAKEMPDWSEADDTLRPDEAMMSQAAEPLAALAALLPGASAGAVKKKAKKRASKSAAGGGAAAKRAKKEPVDVSALDWSALAASGILKKQTVATLKAGCGALGLKLSGKKADLVARIEEHFAT